jgi:hypothetical protein
MQDITLDEDRILTYSEAVASRLFCKAGEQYGGLECYAVKKTVDAAAIVLIYCVATGRLHLPEFITRFSRGSIYAIDSYKAGMQVGWLTWIPLACVAAYILAASPVAPEDAQEQEDWWKKSPAERWGHAASIVGQAVRAWAYSVIPRWAALAVIGLYRVFHGFFSGLCGWLDAMMVSAWLYKLLGGIAVWNLRATAENEDPRTEKGWYADL